MTYEEIQQKDVRYLHHLADLAEDILAKKWNVKEQKNQEEVPKEEPIKDVYSS